MASSESPSSSSNVEPPLVKSRFRVPRVRRPEGAHLIVNPVVDAHPLAIGQRLGQRPRRGVKVRTRRRRAAQRERQPNVKPLRAAEEYQQVVAVERVPFHQPAAEPPSVGQRRFEVAF